MILSSSSRKLFSKIDPLNPIFYHMKFIATETISLLEALALLAPESSITSHRSWLKQGRVFVDGIQQKLPKTVIQTGQVITLANKPRLAEGKFPIVYEDAHLVIIDKPEGLLSVATPYETGDTVHGILKVKYGGGKVFPVHRLDKDTSGLLLFALSDKSREKFKDLFSKHEVERTYLAIVEGKVFPETGTWTSHQYEDSNYYVHNTTDPEKGKFALTHFRVKGYSKNYTLIELKLETGRKNQIRAHCEMAGHPIAGDKKYGAKTNPAKRVCLHACALTFQHPFTGKTMKFASPAPEIFHKVVKVTTSHA